MIRLREPSGGGRRLPKGHGGPQGRFKGTRAKGPFSTDDEVAEKGHCEQHGAVARGLV